MTVFLWPERLDHLAVRCRIAIPHKFDPKHAEHQDRHKGSDGEDHADYCHPSLGGRGGPLHREDKPNPRSASDDERNGKREQGDEEQTLVRTQVRR
jgi:hypothetical protein